MYGLAPLQEAEGAGLNKSSFFIYLDHKEESRMLVLGRKPGEYVVIGENIKVKVVKSDKGDLRLAIEAPNHV